MRAEGELCEIYTGWSMYNFIPQLELCMTIWEWGVMSECYNDNSLSEHPFVEVQALCLH